MSITKINEHELDKIAGGKLKVKSWYYSCNFCGYSWDRYNSWYKKTIDPDCPVGCPSCGAPVKPRVLTIGNGNVYRRSEIESKRNDLTWKKEEN